MYREEVVLENKTGLHARPASMFVKEASTYKSDINLIKEDQKYNAKSIMGLLSMGAAKGDVLTIEAEGEDEKEAVNSLIEFIKNLKE
ncbi:HPr family phosphocarrier protein [Tissierella creatinophila]|uniref:Phosphocarrier protein HPr n=1 Tax=Tissierella creatinophila DSM 6911 TaxID=1123403 RepID=A0A1U7M475_TISCR|nr:HPr family phosphocarrier protein [Tissierella creatinophila]OLS02086.1 HPr-like protein Crh [Tissierella creatinophila DSM 6911]